MTERDGAQSPYSEPYFYGEAHPNAGQPHFEQDIRQGGKDNITYSNIGQGQPDTNSSRRNWQHGLSNMQITGNSEVSEKTFAGLASLQQPYRQPSTQTTQTTQEYRKSSAITGPKCLFRIHCVDAGGSRYACARFDPSAKGLACA